MDFETWFDTFVSEKGITTEHTEHWFYIQSEISGENIIPFSALREYVFNVNHSIQSEIKHTFVMIDFYNGDVMHFFNHLATGMVVARDSNLI